MSPKIGMEPIRRKQAIDAAKVCILNHGFAHFSIKDVAKEAGISTGVLYHYFQNKQDLLVQVLKETFAETEQSVRKAVDSNPSFESKFTAYLETVVHVPENNPSFYLLLLNYLAQSPYNEDVRELVQKFFGNLTSYLDTILFLGVQENKLSELQAGTLSRLIIGQAMGLAFQENLHPHEKMKEHRQEFVRIFQHYLAQNK
ncbi:TetR/AcrR family transcriptional regulator [Alteribacillus sp. HJP-4]|uniref:TetR/AcrR family transcriptional regulator n=1 Tax=Alteribacillus sp. HJP-4 TaxID=2775394 RepID=UPI0035CD1214